MNGKTEDLIEEARRLENDYGDNYEVMTHMSALADALEAATSERSVVPDSAPEGQVIIPIARIYELRAAKDAALAAVERVRALVTEWKHEGPSGPFPDRISIDVGIEVIEPLLAALDGAPEPDGRWEYGYELIEPDDRNVFEREGDFISAAFAYRAAKKRIDEEHQADLPRLQYLIVRRRKAGPWLPVEGESKP